MLPPGVSGKLSRAMRRLAMVSRMPCFCWLGWGVISMVSPPTGTPSNLMLTPRNTTWSAVESSVSMAPLPSTGVVVPSAKIS
ncbi:hypothetical protein FQZ97_1079130 [compost metagenome]